jgi:hypothetical protein
MIRECIYRGRIDWESNDPEHLVDEEIIKFALSLRKEEVDVITTGAGPCWNAYVILESKEAAQVDFLGKTIEIFIKKQGKKAKLLV